MNISQSLRGMMQQIILAAAEKATLLFLDIETACFFITCFFCKMEIGGESEAYSMETDGMK